MLIVKAITSQDNKLCENIHTHLYAQIKPFQQLLLLQYFQHMLQLIY